MKKLIVILILVLTSCSQKKEVDEVLPNIVYILADDMGYGDLSALNPNYNHNGILITFFDFFLSFLLYFLKSGFGFCDRFSKIRVYRVVLTVFVKQMYI